MKRALAALLAMSALSGCRFIPGTQDHEIAEARKAVAYQLRDPDSAKFRDDHLIDVKGQKIVCGEVNGRNGLGAYDGFGPYSYYLSKKVAVILPPADQAASYQGKIDGFASSCLPHGYPWLGQPGDISQSESDDLNAAANDAIADINAATL